jgi:hypothetical protein
MVHSAVTDLYQSGEMIKTAKLFYVGMPTKVWRRWTEQKKGKVWMYNNWNPVADEYLTTRIKVTKDDSNKATMALYCHWSQLTKDEMEETSRWMKSTDDTVFLRPFFSASKISYDLIH